MYGKVYSSILHGIDGTLISVETDISSGMPSFEMVGFLSSEVKEAKERVRSALLNSGYELPVQRITVNLSPANIRKSGSCYDLPIALSILIANDDVKATKDSMIIGELGLDGHVHGINGVLPMVLAAKENGLKKIILPSENEVEARLVPDIEIVPVDSLLEAIDYLKTGKLMPESKYFFVASGIKSVRHLDSKENSKKNENIDSNVQNLSGNKNIPNEDSAAPDFSDIKGQKMLKRACEVAIAGMHNILMIGPPGAGKTLIAKCIPSILPPMTKDEQLEISKIYSVSGMFSEREKLLDRRPFRNPHHTITEAGLAGGGNIVRPGEISLAHNGVLFLDELPEFSPSTLEVLRQPLEEKEVRLVRASGEYKFPSNFVLVCAMNPCKCGYFPDMDKCRCTRSQILKYLSRVSQPLIDRIDITVEARPLTFSLLGNDKKEEPSSEIRKRVLKCHEIEKKRFPKEQFNYNSEIPPGKISLYCPLKEKDLAFMEDIYKSMSLTARTYHKILRVARTIADLDGSIDIERKHLQEAICYRSCDRKYWENTLAS